MLVGDAIIKRLDQATADKIAGKYFHPATTPKRLGWGVSGYVYLSPDLRRAVKVHRYEEPFKRELDVYRRLRDLQISNLMGLTIPRLLNSEAGARIIEMDFVKPPYLLDFAGCTFTPPDEMLMEGWHDAMVNMFGANVDVVYAVYAALARYGIHYLDFRPSNMNLTGLPGLHPPDTTTFEDL